jgi:histone acetyltransferase (RNA polymerase elongator complex component)
MQFRADPGGTSGNVRQIAGVAPGWLRLTRTGSTITGKWSTDGVTWTTLGDLIDSTLPSTVYVGIVVTSHATGLATAHYDDLVVSR